MTSELIERVARAIANTTDFDGDRIASRYADSELRDIAQSAITAVIEADRKAVRAEVARAIEVELSMCAIANVEAPSEWIDGFEFAWKRVKAVLEKHND